MSEQKGENAHATDDYEYEEEKMVRNSIRDDTHYMCSPYEKPKIRYLWATCGTNICKNTISQCVRSTMIKQTEHVVFVQAEEERRRW